MRLVIRADASPAIGGGHVVRSRAVAEALVARGWDACFAARAELLPTVAAMAGAIQVISLDGAVDDEPRELAANLPEGCDVLIVDHYKREVAFESACRGWARRIMAIDDLPVRDHDCDVLVDPTAGREANAYRGRVPDAARVLAGPGYAPLRPQFARARWDRDPEAAPVGGPLRLLVTMGATDPDNLTCTVLRALDTIQSALEVTIVLSGAAPHLDEVRAAIGSVHHTVQLETDVADMASLMAASDLAVGAAGGATWERCCLGLPSVVVQSADNQRDVLAGLAAAGAALTVARAEPDVIAAVVRSLIADPARRAAMSRAATALCDGLGAARIALALAGDETAGDGVAVTLRPVAGADVDILLDWQRSPETRRHARKPAIPSEAEHRAWFAAKRADPGCVFHMLERDGRPVGFVRLDRDRARRAFEIAIAVAPGHRGQGVGGAGLTLIRRLLPDACLRAYVKPENAASLRLFAAAGYRPAGNDWYESGSGS